MNNAMGNYLNKIIQGDCIEIMKTMGDKSVDLILTDPPYNAKNIGPNERKYSVGTMQLPLSEYKKFCKDWFREALRVAKTIVFTPGITNMCYYPQPTWALCWHKPAAVSFNRFGGFNAWEPIFVYGKVAKGKRLGQDYIILSQPFTLSYLSINKYRLPSIKSTKTIKRNCGWLMPTQSPSRLRIITHISYTGCKNYCLGYS